MITEIRKDAIFTMRQQGYSYSEIAKRLFVSSNTVKSLCYRSGIKVPPLSASSSDSCKNCGASLAQNSNGRKSAFCSDQCRYTWWNQHRRRQPYRLICFQCGKPFISYGNRKRKFCSRECYMLSRYGGDCRNG